MKAIIIFALVTVAIAAQLPQPKGDETEPQVKIENDVKIAVNEIHRHLDGTYEIDVELSNGQIWIENAVLKTVLDEEGNEKTILVVSGVSEYKNADGSIDHREYKSDENGAKITGNSVPNANNDASPRSAEPKAPAPKTAAPNTAESKAAKPKASKTKAAAHKAKAVTLTEAAPKAVEHKATETEAAIAKATLSEVATPKSAPEEQAVVPKTRSTPKDEPAPAKIEPTEEEDENKENKNENDDEDDDDDDDNVKNDNEENKNESD